MALPKHIQETLGEALARLGLNKSETKVFIYLFEHSAAERISTIALRTKVNRTTLYGILKTLSEKGLVSSVEERGVLTYRAVEPSFLVDSIQRQTTELSADADKIHSLLPQIEQVRKKPSRSIPTIQFFDGVEGIKQAYEDTIKSNPERKLYGFTGTEAIYRSGSVDQGWIDEYISRRTKAGVRWYSIATESPESHAMKVRDPNECRTTKILPPGYKSSLELCTYGDKVMIASFSQDHPLGILIEDKEIAETVKTLFRYIDSTLSA